MMMTLIVASLVERGIAGVSRSSMKAFSEGADVVEVRFDALDGVASDLSLVDAARAAVKGPAMATYRSLGEGGEAPSDASRREVLEKVSGAGFEYIDLELDVDRNLLRDGDFASGTTTIASHHFAGPVPRSEVTRSLERVCAEGDIGKVAMPCETGSQALMLAEVGLARKERGERFTLIGMGSQGQLTRACARGIGSWMVYACMPGTPAAPGQLDLGTQRDVLNEDAIITGLVGHPVSHSVSKPMQEAAMAQAGLRGIYLPIDMPPRTFRRRTLETMAAIGLKGVNITIPHKRTAMRISDETAPSTVRIGAVNTVVFSNSRISAENTDTYGFRKLIERKKVRVRDREVLVIGAGGAARAVTSVMRDMGAALTVSSRRGDAARALAASVGSDVIGYSTLRSTKKSFDVVVNCTPIGTRGTSLERSALPANLFKQGTTLVDLVYNPPTTKSMEAAADRGCKAHGGLDMLVFQGERAFEAWTGVAPDTDCMRRAARRALR